MCPFIRRMVVEYLLLFYMEFFDFLLLTDFKSYLYSLLSELVLIFYSFCSSIKLFGIKLIDVFIIHYFSFTRFIFSSLNLFINDLTNLILNHYFLICTKQLFLILYKIKYVMLSNLSCFNKYYHIFVFLVLFFIFLTVELYKNFFFLKKKIIISQKKLKFVYIYSSPITLFYNNFKNKLFN